MFCRHCGKEVPDKAVVCVGCGVAPKDGDKYCNNCGKETNSKAVICVGCGVKLATATVEQNLPSSINKDSDISKKDYVTTILLALFFGWFGAHRFYTGHILSGLFQFLTFGGFFLWSFIDLILIISGSFKDAEGKVIKPKSN